MGHPETEEVVEHVKGDIRRTAWSVPSAKRNSDF